MTARPQRTVLTALLSRHAPKSQMSQMSPPTLRLQQPGLPSRHLGLALHAERAPFDARNQVEAGGHRCWKWPPSVAPTPLTTWPRSRASRRLQQHRHGVLRRQRSRRPGRRQPRHCLRSPCRQIPLSMRSTMPRHWRPNQALLLPLHLGAWPNEAVPAKCVVHPPRWTSPRLVVVVVVVGAATTRRRVSLRNVAGRQDAEDPCLASPLRWLRRCRWMMQSKPLQPA